MRIVSQDRMRDIIYDSMGITLNDKYNELKAWDASNKPFTLGSYSTREKALKVMEMIRHHQQQLIDFDCSAIKGIKDRPSIYFYMPQDNEVKE